MAQITKRKRDAALAFANKVRRALGMKPVTTLQPGRRHKAHACPIANTIRGESDKRVAVGVEKDDRAYAICGSVSVTGGRVAAEFIGEFDKGHAPDLVES